VKDKSIARSIGPFLITCVGRKGSKLGKCKSSDEVEKI